MQGDQRVKRNTFSFQDGKSLPNTHRHEIRPNGKFVIHYVEKGTDDGTYWCTGRNNRGVSAKGRLDVTVVGKRLLLFLILFKS